MCIRNNSIFAQERSHYTGDGLMVWIGIFIGGRADHHIYHSEGQFDGSKVCRRDPQTHVISYAETVGDFFLLKKDNARHYTALIVENFTELETIPCMEWPTGFPDLNLIKHV
ncbi:hypothetical protein TNCV_3543281 [Trichonephila clavipes]|nr:hypothetical protein TNCV_3543281 [Trichonephila clavipes]